MADIEPIRRKLQEARASLVEAVAQVPKEKWRQQPGQGGWSAAEVIAHLTMAEKRMQEAIAKMFAHEPAPAPLWRRFAVPPKVSEYRLIKVKSPIPLDPALLSDKQPMMEAYLALRRRTLEVLEANRGRDLRRWRMPHPFFGNLDGWGWFMAIGCHEVRHTKQLREIVKKLT